MPMSSGATLQLDERGSFEGNSRVRLRSGPGALSHLVFVRCKRGKDFAFLAFGHLDVVKRPSKLSGHLVELGR